jgi:hypothetical protein
MEENVKQEEKLTYEQLENAANQLLAQNDELRRTLMELSNAMRRLDYLFKVLDHVALFDVDFVDNCTAEIVQLMTIPEKQDPTEVPVDDQESK